MDGWLVNWYQRICILLAQSVWVSEITYTSYHWSLLVLACWSLSLDLEYLRVAFGLMSLHRARETEMERECLVTNSVVVILVQYYHKMIVSMAVLVAVVIAVVVDVDVDVWSFAFRFSPLWLCACMCMRNKVFVCCSLSPDYEAICIRNPAHKQPNSLSLTHKNQIKCSDYNRIMFAIVSNFFQFLISFSKRSFFDV